MLYIFLLHPIPLIQNMQLLHQYSNFIWAGRRLRLILMQPTHFTAERSITGTIFIFLYIHRGHELTSIFPERPPAAGLAPSTEVSSGDLTLDWTDHCSDPVCQDLCFYPDPSIMTYLHPSSPKAWIVSDPESNFEAWDYL